MFVQYINSGTTAILKLLKSNCIDNVIVAEDLCPEVMQSILKIGVKLLIAPVSKLGRSADYYITYFSNQSPYIKTAILFSHAYGVYDEDQLNNLKKHVLSSDILINDCCLCDPIEMLDIHNLSLPAVCSFGYSKVLDLECGGLLLTSEKYQTDLPRNLIKHHITRFDYRYLFETKSNVSVRIDAFKSSLFYLMLLRYRNDLFLRKSQYRCILKNTFHDCNFLDSPWRFVLFTNFNQPTVQELQDRALKCGVFLGANYPLIKLINDDLTIDIEKMNSIGWPINIFTDFRVTDSYIKKVCKLLRSEL